MSKVFNLNSDNKGFSGNEPFVGFDPGNSDWAFNPDSSADPLHTMHELMAVALIARFPNVRRILDVGSGVGSLAFYLRQHNPDLEVYTFDGYERSMESPFINPDYHIVGRTDEVYKIADEEGNILKFDLIVSFEHLEHIQEKNLQTWFNNIYRHSIPGHTVIFFMACTDDYGAPELHCNAKSPDWWNSFIRSQINLGFPQSSEIIVDLYQAALSYNYSLVERSWGYWYSRFKDSITFCRQVRKIGTVWTNGCFDVLHRGHIEMLNYAASLGHKLYVGIDSDAKVKLDKGNDRPFHSQEDRKFLLESLQCVDEVVVFNTAQELEDQVKKLEPRYLVVGGDWKDKPVIGSEHAAEVKFFDRIPGHSTTAILEKNENIR
jgi:D-beta-D-heptose 7-phosphate kinase/D-beta-D-heptose 1-phosphate adenosyltransferase